MKACDVMTPRVVTIREDASLEVAARLMLEEDISCLPVIDRAGNLAGIVAEEDFLRQSGFDCSATHPRWLELVINPWPFVKDYPCGHTRRVSDIMSRGVFMVGEEANIGTVVCMMEGGRASHIVVQRQNDLVGIISRGNLLHMIVGADISPYTAQDRCIRARIFDAIEAQRWIPSVSLDPVVRNGIVELHGFVRHEQERIALTAAVSEIDGVVAIRDHLLLVNPQSDRTPRVLLEQPVAMAASLQ
jgi:CBS domain-containing protein